MTQTTIEPARSFDDMRTMVGPKKSLDSSVCWCLSYRVPNAINRELVGVARAEYVEALCRRDVAPGVFAYQGEEVVGWAAVAPRRETAFARSRRIPHVDDRDVWAVWCLRVRPGHRGEGISHALLSGAVEFAHEHGAPAVEGYPVDNRGERVNLTMAYVGTKKLFEGCGFRQAATTQSVLDGFPRVVMRLDLENA
jgi:GNAT superfamily N-acetyltransferase